MYKFFSNFMNTSSIDKRVELRPCGLAVKKLGQK